MDYNWVTNRLAVGAAVNNEADVEQLINDGITAVIDARGEFDDVQYLATHSQITYLYAGTPDDGQPKPASYFKPIIEFGLSVLSRPGTKILTHCAAGVNRGPSAGFALLVALGLPYGDAFDLIKKNRPIVQIAYSHDAYKAAIELGYVSDHSTFGEKE